MQTVEITAKSVDEATRAAAEKLGVSPAEISVTVLEETKGLFGRSTVRIRAEVVPAKPAKAPKAPKPVAVAVPKEPIASIQEAVEAPAPKRGSRKPKATEPVPEPTPVAEEQDEPTVVATDDDGRDMADLVKDLLAAARLQVNVRVGELNGRYVNLILDGKDAAFLVGKHGEVLNALQYLVNVIGGRKLANGVRATLDCNDYRRRREEALTGLATRIAAEVKARREEAVLDALPAFERRIVHKALAEIQGVATYSEGEEPNRRVVIAPAE